MPAPKGNTNNLKYKKEYINEIDNYLKECHDEYEKVEKQSSESAILYERKLKVNLPSIEGFSKYIGISRKTLYNWSDSYVEFENALDKISEAQKKVLIEKGLSGDYNSTIAKLVLSVNHNMIERKEIDVREHKILLDD